MSWDEIDFNSILIIIGAICITILKIIEMWKSGSYRNTKLTNSKEEMKQVEALRSKYREKFKKQIQDIKEDMLKKIQNKKFDDEFENIIERLTELYTTTSDLITSRSSSEDLMDHKKDKDKDKLIELKEITDKQRARAQSHKEEFAEKVRSDILKRLSEHLDNDDVEINMAD